MRPNSPHSFSTGPSLLRSPSPLPHRADATGRSPYRLPPPSPLAPPWSRLNALASLCTPPVRCCTHARARAPSLSSRTLFLFFFVFFFRPSFLLTRARRFSPVIVNERAIDNDRFASRRLACRLYSRLTARQRVRARALTFRGKLSGRAPEDRDRAWRCSDGTRVPGTRRLTRSPRNSIDSSLSR